MAFDTWLVQTGELGKEVDYGVVSDGHGFEDSPDCERISGGVNSKGPYAVAIGRQANMLQWGFYAAPDRMTDSAKKAFLNAIVYMRQFDGQRPLVEKKAYARSWLEQQVAAVRNLPRLPDDANQRQQLQQRNPVDDRRRQYLASWFPARLVADGLDADKLEQWRADNVEFLHSAGGTKILVDEDLQKLGLSNRKPEFLDWLVRELRADAPVELPLTLARRYLGDEHGRDAATALGFIEQNRPWLFFSDSGGYRWFVDINARAAAPAPAAVGRERD